MPGLSTYIIGKRSAVVMEHSTSFGVPMEKAVAATTLKAMWKTQTVKAAKVCLHTYSQGAEPIACTTSDVDGKYSLPAVPHVPCVVRITLGSHMPPQFHRNDATSREWAPTLQSCVEMKPSLTSDIECAGCMEVFTFVPSEKVVEMLMNTKMKYEDRTVRLLDVDVHGTLCKHPLGDVAFLKFDVPNCGHRSVLLPTSYQTNNLVQLPAQLYDVTLDAVEPPYPEATAVTQFGYFRRLRTRTQQTDLSDELNASPEEDGGERIAGTNVHAVVFQYHPAPDLNIQFLETTRERSKALEPTACNSASAVDTSIGDETKLVDDQVPGWVMRTGMPFAAVASPVATIKFPEDKHATCDWIEGHISHVNNIGLSRSDQHFFKHDAVSNKLVPKDSESTEYRDFAKIVNKTLPAQVQLADLARCGHPEDPACLVATTHLTATSARTDFSDDSTCTSPQHAGHLRVQLGYTIHDADATSCAALWAKQLSVPESQFHAWHLTDWDHHLTAAQQKAWENAGVNEEHFKRGQTTKTWRYFSKTVLSPTLSWSMLEQKNASITRTLASELHFNSDTWGRAWAFADRIFLNDVAILPDWNEDLTGAEQSALESLGYSETNWADPSPKSVYTERAGSSIYANPKEGDFTITDWSKLGGPKDAVNQRGNVTGILKITPWHWMRAKKAVGHGKHVKGCFWDHGRGQAATTAWISNLDSVRRDADNGGGDRRRRQINDHWFVRKCPAGQISERDPSHADGSICSPCPDGEYKTDAMNMSTSCKEKTTACFKGAYLHRGESKTRDDNICVPIGQCAPGYEMGEGETCKECLDGYFKDLVSSDRCVAKALGACKPGQYTLLGDDRAFDDTLCIPCPLGTFAKLGNAAQCSSKAMMAKCDAGTYLKLGTRTTEDDNKCERCEAGSWKSEDAPQTSCTEKLISDCPPGEYLYAGPSVDADDNRCIACPTGTFSTERSSAMLCRAKSHATCQLDETLHRGESSQEDDYICVKPGSCPAGYHVKSVSTTTTTTAETKATDTSSAGIECVRCPLGTFSSRVTTDAECAAKRIIECPLGTFVSHGESITVDDAKCTPCPHGTYKGPMHSLKAAVCFLKLKLTVKCPAGTHVSRGLSRTLDDHECQPCREGSFQPHADTSAKFCDLKSRPIGGCPPGRYLSLGVNAARDDYECLQCPDGTFKSADAGLEATMCTAKTQKQECKESEVLIPSGNSVNDDLCVVPARCQLGEQVAKDQISQCEECPVGKYMGDMRSVSKKCRDKVLPPDGCVRGTYYTKGNSTTRDDWQCIECPPGMYSEKHTTVTEETEPSTCTMKALPKDECSPGEEMHWGEKKNVSDWFCIPASRYTALCAKTRQFGARSLMPRLAAGMPGRVAPFTAQYRATMAVAGYAPVHAVEVVVVTGARYVSDAEKVPFPEGRPLLVLHDAPGGESFSSFINTQVTTTVTTFNTEKTDASNNVFNIAVGTEFEVDVAPTTQGTSPIMIGAPAVAAGTTTKTGGPASLKTAGGVRDELNFNHGWTDRVSSSDEMEGDTFEFTYKTSALPERAGPASDAFLMPALTFEVIEVWIVKFAANTPSECNIRGFTDKSLKARSDLSAFYFITANDVETRTLPQLLDISNDVKRRLDCDEGKGCCTKEELEVFCKASDLDEYCNWKYDNGAADVSGGFKRCKSIAEDHWKTKCAAAARLARLRNEGDTIWSECARSNPTCPPEFRRVGNAVTPCHKDLDAANHEIDMEALKASAKSQKKKNDVTAFKVRVESELDNVKKCAENGCSAVDSSFKVKCAPVREAIGHLSVCSKNSIFANSVEQYCSVLHADDTENELACTTYTPTDQYARAHDDWYNSLSRNFAKQEKAIVGTGVAVPYTVLDTLNTGAKPVASGEFVRLEPMKRLAPTMLIHNAMDQAGENQSDDKKKSFFEYNTLSFEGGGSSMSYRWETGETQNGNDFVGFVKETTREHKTEKLSSVALNPHGHFKFTGISVDVELKATDEQVVLNVGTNVTSASDEAYAAFTLIDPDAGDYFVVTVWEDPEYPTPLFAIQGGASSCKWEYNTYHRAAPALSITYTGPHFLPSTEPAVFNLRLENAVQYYESGPITEKRRPGWTELDKGYFLPALSLAVWPETIMYGLSLWINGRAFTGDADLTFPQFGKGSTEVLVEVHAGPVGHEPTSGDSWRTYPAPVFTFGQRCNQAFVARDIGERAVDAALGMAGGADKRVVRYLQSCPALQWSGDIKAESTFIIDADTSHRVDFVVSNPTGMNFKSLEPVFKGLEFQYRFVDTGNVKWLSAAGNSIELDADTAAPKEAFVKGRWKGPPSTSPDGVYDIRVVAKCTNDAPLDEYSHSSTSTLQGVVDRKPPTMLSAILASGGRILLPGGLVTATFDEGILCQRQLDLTLTTAFSGGAESIVFSVQDNHLNYVCRGPAISIALTEDGVNAFNNKIPDLSVLVGATVTLSVRSGVVDAAGNAAAGALSLGYAHTADEMSILEPIRTPSNPDDTDDASPPVDAPVGDDKDATVPVDTPGGDDTGNTAGTPDDDDRDGRPSGTQGTPSKSSDADGQPDGEDYNGAPPSGTPGTPSKSSDADGEDYNGTPPSEKPRTIDSPSRNDNNSDDETISYTAGASSNDLQASLAGVGSAAATNSYVAMVLIIIVMVGMFVYNQRAMVAMTEKLNEIRSRIQTTGATEVMPEANDDTSGFAETAFNARHLSAARDSSDRMFNNGMYGTTTAATAAAALTLLPNPIVTTMSKPVTEEFGFNEPAAQTNKQLSASAGELASAATDGADGEYLTVVTGLSRGNGENSDDDSFDGVDL